jgi:alkanesulfonate monooxygenase SsuD/methylene tetrahydromethanopterin reductase-like flavin-dependent oxidoreductase (luciferase family)
MGVSVAAPNIGLFVRTFNIPGNAPAPRWAEIEADVQFAETAGFNSVSFADHHLWRLEDGTMGFWEAYTMVSAVAAVTSRIEVGVSVTNAPFRNPALLAKMADTLDEISGGRFVLGLGAGGGYPSDYETMGIPTDRRFSRFAETLTIVQGLLRDGTVDYSGTYYSAPGGELSPRGPSARGPRLVIGAKGPKMLDLAARYADEWNWYHYAGVPSPETFAPLQEALDEACRAIGRDPASIRRSVDFAIAPDGDQDTARHNGLGGALAGSVAEIAEAVAAFGTAGIDEVRLAIAPDDSDHLAKAAEIVALLQS